MMKSKGVKAIEKVAQRGSTRGPEPSPGDLVARGDPAGDPSRGCDLAARMPMDDPRMELFVRLQGAVLPHWAEEAKKKIWNQIRCDLNKEKKKLAARMWLNPAENRRLQQVQLAMVKIEEQQQKAMKPENKETRREVASEGAKDKAAEEKIEVNGRTSTQRRNMRKRRIRKKLKEDRD